MVVKLPLHDFYPEGSPFKTENFTVKDPTIEDEDRLFNPDRIKGGYALDDFVRVPSKSIPICVRSGLTSTRLSNR